MKFKLLLLFWVLFCVASQAQDSTFLKVHFLYGSKPSKAYKDTEDKWFGGKLGGHVGIEVDSNVIFSFVPREKVHWIARKKVHFSKYTSHSHSGFYSLFGSHPDSVKKALVFIPISAQEKITFDSLMAVYINKTPYDYAFIGMRCGSATYDVLGHLGIVPKYRRSKTSRKIFYPRKLRKRLFKEAKMNGWQVDFQEGTSRRIWEKDK